MKIDLLNPYGYCKGVINAINLVKKTRENNPDTPIYIWGNLVHNEHVTNALKKINVITIEKNLKEKSFEILSKLDKGFLI
ncbi:MAG: 4-hydroxy-3-methylbut-2-enyl diphosphate reductase, partial [Bacilli bacterium]